MARKRNIRNLRWIQWNNPMFSMYCAKPQSVYNWTTTLGRANKVLRASRKLV